MIGGPHLQVVRPDGTVTLEWSVPDMSVVQVETVRLGPGAPTALALLAAAPRDTKRWRLQLLDAEGTLLYDEILEHGPGLLTARRTDGADTLLVSGGTLEALRPIGPLRAARAR